MATWSYTIKWTAAGYSIVATCPDYGEPWATEGMKIGPMTDRADVIAVAKAEAKAIRDGTAQEVTDTFDDAGL